MKCNLPVYSNNLNYLPCANRSSHSAKLSSCPQPVFKSKIVTQTMKTSKINTNKILKFFEKYKSQINYTWKHKQAFLKLERKLLGKNTFGGLCHDLDKLIMYILFIPEELANKIHRKFSSHHLKNGKIKNIQNAVIDWECARTTKKDKPLNARETYEKYYKDVPGIKEVLERFRL